MLAKKKNIDWKIGKKTTKMTNVQKKKKRKKKKEK